MLEEEKIQWLQIARTPGIGPITFSYLIERFSSVEKIIEVLPDFSRSLNSKRMIVPMKKSLAYQEYEKHKEIGAEIITTKEFPVSLKSIDDAPIILSILGEKAMLQEKLFSVVGSRIASSAGIAICKNIVENLSANDQVIVSGMAKGIDSQAHLSSIDKGTIAVLGGGINNIYPIENKDLYEKIKEKGLIISESPLNQKITANSFPKRNRIIAGLSWGTLIVEANNISGSLLTAKLACEYGREVFAVPGHPLDSRSRGVNQLIKNGATLVENSDDITGIQTIFEMPQSNIEEKTYIAGDKEIKSHLLQILSSVPVSIDTISRQYGYPIHILRSSVIEMNIAGQVNFSNDKVSKIL